MEHHGNNDQHDAKFANNESVAGTLRNEATMTMRKG